MQEKKGAFGDAMRQEKKKTTEGKREPKYLTVRLGKKEVLIVSGPYQEEDYKYEAMSKKQTQES